MVAFIDAHREEFGVEPICRELPIAPSTYYGAKSRPASARSCRHAAMTAALKELWRANFGVYGARKLWLAARRAGHEIGRDQTARLMRAAGLSARPGGGRASPAPAPEGPGPAISSDATSPPMPRIGCGSAT